MLIRLAGLTADSIVDGPGMRLTVFTQGCVHACPGCHNPSAHALDGGTLAETDDILAQLARNALQAGITLSGGEPFLQPEACLALAEGVHAQGKTVWAFTGWTWEELLREDDPARMALLRAVDVLVDGPFLLAERTLELPFRGSRNQRLIDVPRSLAASCVVPFALPVW